MLARLDRLGIVKRRPFTRVLDFPSAVSGGARSPGILHGLVPVVLFAATVENRAADAAAPRILVTAANDLASFTGHNPSQGVKSAHVWHTQPLLRIGCMGGLGTGRLTGVQYLLSPWRPRVGPHFCTQPAPSMPWRSGLIGVKKRFY